MDRYGTPHPAKYKLSSCEKKQNSCQRNSVSEKKLSFFQRIFGPRFHFSGLNQLRVLDPDFLTTVAQSHRPSKFFLDLPKIELFNTTN